MQYKSNIVYSNHLAGNCQSSECVKTQLSSIKEVGLDGDTCSNASKINYDIKASDGRYQQI